MTINLTLIRGGCTTEWPCRNAGSHGKIFTEGCVGVGGRRTLKCIARGGIRGYFHTEATSTRMRTSECCDGICSPSSRRHMQNREALTTLGAAAVAAATMIKLYSRAMKVSYTLGASAARTGKKPTQQPQNGYGISSAGYERQGKDSYRPPGLEGPLCQPILSQLQQPDNVLCLLSRR